MSFSRLIIISTFGLWFQGPIRSKFYDSLLKIDGLSFLQKVSILSVLFCMITHHTVLDLFRTDFICPFHFNCSISSYWNPVWKFSSQNYSYHKKEDILFGRCAMVDWMFVTFPQSFLLPREKPKALHEYLSTHFIFLSKLYHLSKSELIFVQ